MLRVNRKTAFTVILVSLLLGPVNTVPRAADSEICDEVTRRVDSRFIALLTTSYGESGGTPARFARIGTRLELLHTDLVIVDGQVRARVDGELRRFMAERSVYCVPPLGEVQRIDQHGTCPGDSVLVVTENGLLAANLKSGRVSRLVSREYQWERVYGLLGQPVPEHGFGDRPSLSEVTFPALCEPGLKDDDPLPELVFDLLGIIPVYREEGSSTIRPSSGPGTLTQAGDVITFAWQDTEVRLKEVGEIRVIRRTSGCKPELVLIRVIGGVVVLDLEESAYLGVRTEWMSVEPPPQ